MWEEHGSRVGVCCLHHRNSQIDYPTEDEVDFSSIHNRIYPVDNGSTNWSRHFARVMPQIGLTLLQIMETHLVLKLACEGM